MVIRDVSSESKTIKLEWCSVSLSAKRACKAGTHMSLEQILLLTAKGEKSRLYYWLADLACNVLLLLMSVPFSSIVVWGNEFIFIFN